LVRVWLPLNLECPLEAKLCVGPEDVFEVQERAWGPLSPCQVCWSSDFARLGKPKMLSFLSVCLSVNSMTKFDRAASPSSPCNLQVVLVSLDRGRFVVVRPRQLCLHAAAPGCRS